MTDDLAATFQHLALALGLGLVVGLQRERVNSRLAGVRTFPLVTLFGSLCALLVPTFGGWTFAAGIVALTSLIFVGNVTAPKTPERDVGLTTEVAMLVMFTVGCLVVVGPWELAVALGGVVAVLLHLKKELHGFTARLGDQDLRAIMQFVVVTFIVLPVLPDRTFGPYGVLNPHRAWLMVVLIVSISFGGYICFKLFGAQAGAFLGGVLGGLVSSTATTVSAARRCRADGLAPAAAAAMIVTASAVAHPRVLLELFVVSRELAVVALVPLGLMFGANVVVAIVAWAFVRRQATLVPAPGNPTELKTAITFGLIYAIVIFGTAAARERLGQSGLLGVAVLAGLTDVDAITLSAGALVRDRRIAVGEGLQVVVLALISNLAFKAALAGFLGSRNLLLRVALFLGAVAVAGVLAL